MQRAGGALEFLQHRILLDAGRDDDAGGDTELLAGQVDRLDRLDALELVDRQRVAVDAAHSGGTAHHGLLNNCSVGFSSSLEAGQTLAATDQLREPLDMIICEHLP